MPFVHIAPVRMMVCCLTVRRKMRSFSVSIFWAQYGIDLPGSLHTNKIPVILGRYPLPRFVCRLNIVPLDMDNGTFNSSHTDVVERVNFLMAASQHGGTSVAEASP